MTQKPTDFYPDAQDTSMNIQIKQRCEKVQTDLGLNQKNKFWSGKSWDLLFQCLICTGEGISGDIKQREGKVNYKWT